ncbi:MAG: ABC transporter permease [Lachnoclostridium sp.]|nr:ABC transporter permease [Lachnoclostridium sp.]
MKRLFAQFMVEWRSNLWLVVELVIVSAVLWFVIDHMNLSLSIKFEPDGWNTTNTFRIVVKSISQDSPNFVAPELLPGEDENTAFHKMLRANHDELMRRLRAVEGVEAVTLASFHPHCYNFWGRGFNLKAEPGDTADIQSTFGINFIEVYGDYAQVYDLHGLNGETPQDIDRSLADGMFVITGNVFVPSGIKGETLKNRPAYPTGAPEEERKIGAAIPVFKRAQYEKAQFGTAIVTEPKLTQRSEIEMGVRVDPEKAATFIHDLRNNHPELAQIGNIYISTITSAEDVAASLNRSYEITLRSLTLGIAFLLMTIFLGLLGTFWFRTQQRVSEIAIRMVNGATQGSIFARLISEGLIMLLLSIPFSAALVWTMIHYELVETLWYYPSTIWTRATIEYAGVISLMALTIIAGISIPARKAVKVQPVDVLRGE